MVWDIKIYLRVSNMSSGDNYGTMFIPRVNSEVIVSFVNGDPDCPIIIGSLNNGENKLAYSLPSNKTKSYLRTYTTPQYSDSIGYNELMFEDYQGREEVKIRAQRDLNTEVLNNENKRVDKDQRVIIRGDKEESINKNSKLNVKENYEINVQNDFIENVSNNKVINVSENLDLNVNKNINVNIVENLKYIIEKDFIESVKGNKIEYVEKDVKLRYLNNLFTQVDKDFRLDVKGSYHIKSNSIKQEANIIELIANNGITIRSGANSITVDSSGIHLNSASINTQFLYDDDADYCTIGYGHLVDGKKSCKNISKEKYEKFKNGLSDKEANDLFKKDIQKREKRIRNIVKVNLYQHEFDALISLFYNIEASLNPDFTIMKCLKEKDYEGAGKAFLLWDKGTLDGKKIVLKGLVLRRKAESNIFLENIYDSTH